MISFILGIVGIGFGMFGFHLLKLDQLSWERFLVGALLLEIGKEVIKRVLFGP